VPLTPGLVDHLTLQPLLTAGTGRHYDVDQVTEQLVRRLLAVVGTTS